MKVCWLNLNLYIPQKDVIKKIFCLFNALDWKMIKISHNRALGNKVKEDKDIIAQCALFGYLNLAVWAKEQGCVFNKEATTAAAEGGHLHVIKWLKQNGCPWSVDATVEAAKNGIALLFVWLINYLFLFVKVVWNC